MMRQLRFMLGRRTWPASLAEKRRARRADSVVHKFGKQHFLPANPLSQVVRLRSICSLYRHTKGSCTILVCHEFNNAENFGEKNAGSAKIRAASA